MTNPLLDWAERLNGETRVVGVIGCPIAHSLSPPMQNAAFAALGLNWVYVPFAVSPEDVPGAMAAVGALDLVGLNVTIPHKTAVLPFMDELGESARDLGAVNTIVHREGRLIGHSTDGEGFLRSLQEIGEGVAGKQVTIIGAGGSARSVGLAVLRAGAARLSIVNRTPEKALALRDALAGLAPGAEIIAAGLAEQRARDLCREAEVVIDSTAVGMYPHHETQPVVPAEWLHEGQIVCDLTYNPRDTVLLQAARRKGAGTLDGSGMLLHQGALSFEYWTGQPAPIAAMRETLWRGLTRA